MPGPGCGECTAPQTGPGILLLGLGLSEGLGVVGDGKAGRSVWMTITATGTAVHLCSCQRSKPQHSTSFRQGRASWSFSRRVTGMKAAGWLDRRRYDELTPSRPDAWSATAATRCALQPLAAIGLTIFLGAAGQKVQTGLALRRAPTPRRTLNLKEVPLP